MRFTLRRNDRREVTMLIKHYIGGAEIAMILFTRADEGADLTRADIEALIRRSIAARGEHSYAPECGVDIAQGYEHEFASHARWAVETVRSLWPELEDSALKDFERQYVTDLL